MDIDELVIDDHDNESIDYDSPLTSTPRGFGVSNPLLKKSSFRSRWLVLVLCCTLMSANYYAYDIPSALHQQIQTYMPPSPNFETKFNLLYTAYSFPNTILPLFGGNTVDKYGAPKCQTIFAIAVFVGSSLLSFGVSSQSWSAMYFGRFVFGLGAESLSVAQSTVLSEWFEGKEVAFAMGIALSVSRLGSIWNNLVSPKVANAKNGGVEAAFWLGAMLTSISVVMGCCIMLVDRRATKKIKKRRGDGMESLTAALLELSVVESEFPLAGGSSRNISASELEAGESESVHISDIRKFGLLFWLLSLSCVVVYGCVLPFNNVASGILLERDFFTSSPNCHLKYHDQCADGYLQNLSNPALDSDGSACTIAPSQSPVLPNSVNFTKSDSNATTAWDKPTYFYSDLQPSNVHCGDDFWFAGCTMNYCAKEHSATEKAGKVMSIPYLISSVSSPLLGHMIDKVGRRAVIATVASTILLLVHLSLALLDCSPVGPMVGQGIAYSLYAAVLWPSVPLTVSKQFIGTAFGVITSIQNMGLALFPLAIATIYNSSGNNYIPNVEFFFASCAASGVVIGILMIRVDKKTGGRLNSISSTRSEESDFRRTDDFDPLNDEVDGRPIS
eukprot:CCRYP_006549-RA/>CCRYP_006549-RA protein AED:0.02 eAED:0.02 QI:208/1/1/1/1/1/3/273/614